VFAISCLLPSPEVIVKQYASNPIAIKSYVYALVTQGGAHVMDLWYAYAIIVACLVYILTSRPPVYLMDFSVFEPPLDWRVSRSEIIMILRKMKCFNEESISFMQRLLDKSGTGEATHWPPGTVKLIRPTVTPAKFIPQPLDGAKPSAISTPSHLEYTPLNDDVPDLSITAARNVAEMVLCATFQDLLNRTGIKAKDVDFLIVNCSLFNPTPSLASMVTRAFGLRSDVRTYNLGGMGCSASLISIDLAKQLLENSRNSTAVVLSTEEITQQMYRGDRKDLLLQNTLFRVGGAAILLSNKFADGFRAKYKLLHTVRTQDMSQEAKEAVFQCQDTNGQQGISLSREIVKVAGGALKTNLTMLGPQILPIREQVRVVWSIARRSAAPYLNSFAAALGFSPTSKTAENGKAAAIFEKPPVYVPDFKKAVTHFCIHAGGRAVIEGIEKNLNLSPHHTAPSRATLFHWGNTSSSSIWYELRYVEGENDREGSFREEKAVAAAAVGLNKSAASSSTSSSSSKVSLGAAAESSVDGGTPPGWDPDKKWHLPDYENRHIRRGERVLQIAFGSGFKCNSAVWLRMR
jgi:3-ketoacyl-CoA synthase